MRAALPHLSDSMARIAHLLLDKPEAVLSLSISELAAAADTSAATVTRFCQQLGYSGYPALRMSAAADVGRSTAAEAWIREAGATFEPAASPEDIARNLLAAQFKALQMAADLLDVGAVQRVAAAVNRARHVDIYGVGGSGVGAVGLQQRLYRIGVNAHVWTDVHLGLASAALMDPRCVAIALSSSGQTRETLELVALARKQGAFTAALTSDPQSPVARAAEVHLQTSASGHLVDPGQLAANSVEMFVLNLLYVLVAQGEYERADRALRLTAEAVVGRRPTAVRKVQNGTGAPDGLG
jgi:DNA-binding MurR/RpiR family transcriptional regulator